MKTILDKWRETAFAPGHTVIIRAVLLGNVLSGKKAGPATTTASGDKPGL